MFQINSASIDILEVTSSLKAKSNAIIDFSLATYVSGTFQGVGVGLTNVTASYIDTTAITSASYALTSSFAQLAQTASYVLNAVSASHALNSNLFDNRSASTFANTSSNNFVGTQTIEGNIIFTPSNEIMIGANSASFYVTKSYDDVDFSLHYQNNNQMWMMNWLEDLTNTGIQWGGIVSWSADQIYVTPGHGFVTTHNASSASYTGPSLEHVEWGPITASATYITSSQVTYLYINTLGELVQQTTPFTVQQHQDHLTLGAIAHFDGANINNFAGERDTSYSLSEQLGIFARAFGPLKIDGYTLSAQTGSMKLSVGSGKAFILGGFYKEDPDVPSYYESNAAETASIARVHRSGSVGSVFFDANAGNFYTDIDPNKYDDGSGTLQAVPSEYWTIQHVFSFPRINRLFVYYGQSTYPNLADALGNVATDQFVEGISTQRAVIFAGYVVVKSGSTDLGDTATNRILQSGLYRNTAGGSAGGGAAASNIADLADVTITSATDGQALIYDSGFWVNGTPFNAINATNSSTASYVETAQTASYVLQAVSSSFATTASYALNAQVDTTGFILANQTSSMTVATASWATQSVSASYALTASYVIGGGPGGGVQGSGTTNTIPVWTGTTTLGDSQIHQGAESVGIRTNAFNGENPESLLISGSNINIISGIANINNYGQFNIINRQTGNAASADIVATNDLGNESSYYVDLGINSSEYAGIIGGANDAYLYNTGSKFLIGTLSQGTNAKLNLFAGDSTITPIVVTGSTSIVTGSLFGTSSWATNSLTASYVATAQTASYVNTLNQTVTINGNTNIGNSLSNNHIISGTILLSGDMTVSDPSPILTFNTTAASQGYIQFQNSGVAKAFFGVPVNGSGLINGSVAGDLAFRGQASNIIFSGDSGTTLHFKIASDGTTTVTNNFVVNGNTTLGDTTADVTTIRGNSVVTGSLRVTGSLNVLGSITASLFGTSSYATNSATASYVETAQTASYVVTAQTASYVQTAETASYTTQIFTRGGTAVNADGITTNDRYIVWRASYPATVSKVYGYREGGTATNVNATVNTSLLRSTDLSLTNTDTWTDFGALQNTSVATGDSLYIIVSGSGASPTEISIQIDLVRA